jgi:hypothetical protein
VNPDKQGFTTLYRERNAYIPDIKNKIPVSNRKGEDIFVVIILTFKKDSFMK